MMHWGGIENALKSLINAWNEAKPAKQMKQYISDS
jgi:hypothetical protein